MSSNFIENFIEKDIEEGKHDRLILRFPPEPNGYLHIGHAKSICLNFGLASKYKNSACNLRFDDTNPSNEDVKYVEAIKSDVKWLGFDADKTCHASDYFEKLYEYANYLIKKEKAYVCDLSFDEIREHRGTLTEAGKESPYRNRSIEENLSLFESMKNGEFEDGFCVLRLKIDMASPNLNLRDPAIYRIKKNAVHYKKGSKWHIYPMYDFTHPISDSIENITHSLCTLEFEDHRPLYDWILNNLDLECHPQQIEFARMNLTYAVLSKRKLKELVENKYVEGWDDPRMPTIAGLKRRGYTPASIRNFCEKIGVAKKESAVDMALLEHCIREDLNKTAPRIMGILDPVKVVIDNYPEDEVEYLDFLNNPEDESMGYRKVPFSKYLYIDRNDFREKPFRKYFRLAPGREVRLRYAYYITCTDFKKDEKTGEITEIHCTYDPATQGGSSPDGRKVKGTIHWVSKNHALDAKVNLYDRLFSVPNPEDKSEGKDFKEYINPNSLVILNNCKLEPFLKDAEISDIYQFERVGYFCVDINSSKDNLIFNRTVTLRDSWAKIKKNMMAS
jgi:glutaminyl-tRNA synthetase